MTEPGDDYPAEQICRVVAAFGRRLELETPSGETVPARVRDKRLRVVCTDRVVASPLAGEADWVVEERLERATEVARTDSRGQREVLAANVDALIVVIAPLPAPDAFIVDRFLAAARIERIDAAIAANKSDIGSPDKSLLEPYGSIDVPAFGVSAATGAGCLALADWLERRVGVVVGQSGVGKSSLINRLAPDSSQVTARLGQKGTEGRHTTVAARLLRLDSGGELIDSPGVRDFAPHIDDPRRVAAGFAEIGSAASQCRFNDCLHRSEPGCEVRRRLEAGAIDERRYASYRRLLNVTAQVQSKRR